MNLAYIRHALVTACRVARFDREAIEDFDQTFEGFYLSFFCAVLCLPLYVVIAYGEWHAAADIALERTGVLIAFPPPTLALLSVQAVAYALNWLALPFAMIAIVKVIGASARYVPFVVAYNWTACLIFAATVIPYAIYLSGAVDLWGLAFLYYPVTIFVLVYRWRVARDGLQLSGLNAAAIVLLDLLLGLLLTLLLARLRREVA